MYIKEFPNSKYRFEFYVNYGKKTFQQIMREKNCDVITNTWFYDMVKYTSAKTSYAIEASTDCGVIVDGREIGKVVYNEYGVCIDDNGNLFCATQSGQKNYAIGLPVQYKGGQRYPNNTSLPKNGCTHIGFKADGTPVLALVSKDKPMTNDALNEAMLKFGCVDILRYDGSWSSQGNLDGIVVQPSQTRIVQGYLLAYRRDKPTPPERKFKVCLDPGHGIKEPNQSPDGRYLEYKMAWKLSNKIKELLESTERFDVILTKKSEGETPSLSARAKIANDADADIFWSTHSNAVAGGWNDTIHGITAWIYAMGGQREKLARHFLEQCKELELELFGSELYTAKFAVLAQTHMPAVLIENYFHTCRTDVDKLMQDKEIETLAYAAARAICEYFNLSEDIIPLAKKEVEEEYEVWTDILYRVQTGAFANEDNAEDMANLLKKHGFETIIKKEKR